MTGRTTTVLAALVATALAASCGVPVDDEAVVTEPEEVPFQLLEAADATTTTTTPRATSADVYLLSSDEELLAPVPRELPDGDLDAVVAALLDGPTEAEREAGLTTDVDPAAVDGVELTGGVAAVDLGEDFATLDSATQRTAIAQLVYTLTARPGVGRVTFTLDGEPVEVPRGDGALTSGSVSRDAYRELIDPD